jgi:hypothetical protein
MLPRLCDESSKFLCVQRDCQCDFGTKEKCLGFGGEDPNQCILQEQKMLCCVNAADCYCEGLCLPDGTCIRTKADCFCRKEEKSVGGLRTLYLVLFCYASQILTFISLYRLDPQDSPHQHLFGMLHYPSHGPEGKESRCLQQCTWCRRLLGQFRLGYRR